MTRDGCPVGRLGAAGLLVLLAAAPPGHGGRGASLALAESVVVNLGHAGDQYTVGVQLESTNASSGEPPLINARRVLFHTGRTELALVPNSTLDSSAQACAASREEDCSISDVEDAYYTNFTCGRLACRTFDGTVVLNSRGDDDPTTAAEVLLVKSVGTEMPQLHRWRGVDGALGAAFGNRRSAFQGFLANATADGRRLYALDLFPNDTRRSTLRLGGVDPSYEPTLRWGQPQARDELFLVSSFLHDLEICGGINVLGNWSDTWEAVIDTAASCLTLPEQFYDVVTAWLPLTCEDADGRPIRDRKGIQRWCVATSSAPLPALSFRMRPDGSRVYVSLSDLVLDSADVLAEEQRSIGLPVCILKGASLLDGADNYDYTDIPRIVLGTLALRSLYTVVDMDAATVGFANKLSASEINALQDTSLCRPAEECKPTQVFVDYKNKCRDPRCDKYFFMQSSASGDTCVFSRSAVEAGITFVVLLVVAEVIFYAVSQTTAAEHASVRLDPVTTSLGKVLTVAVDEVMYLFDPDLRARVQGSTARRAEPGQDEGGVEMNER